MGQPKGCIPWNKGKRMSNEFKQKCHERQIGKLHSNEWKEIHSKTMKNKYDNGYISPMLGRKHTLKTRQKMSMSSKNIPCTWSNKIVTTRKNKNNYNHTIETKNKIKKTLLQTYIKNPHLIENIKRKRLLQKPVYESSIEKKMQQELKNNNIDFKKHKVIKNIEHMYQCDIFIEPNLVIECDGDYWHNYPNGTIKDRIRNKEMLYVGYKILRFWEHDINNDIERCVQLIKNELK